MVELNIQITEPLMYKLRKWAEQESKKIEDVVVERLEEIPDAEEEDLHARYNQFIRDSGLFVQTSEEEKQKYQAASGEFLREIAAKLGATGPMSQVIIEERGVC